MKENLKILMLEDDVNDAKLIEMYLRRASFQFEPTLVATKEAFVTMLETNTFDVILSDHQLPQFSSLEALQICNQKSILVPFILVTGAVSEEFAVTILQEGANDYVLKDRLHRLPIAIKQAIEKQKIKQEKYASELELKKSNERFELVTRASRDVIWDHDVTTDLLYISSAFTEIYGYPSGYNLKLEDWTNYIHPDDKERVIKQVAEFHASNEWHWNCQMRMVKGNGSIAYVSCKGIALRDEKGKAYRVAGNMQDVTEIRNLQQDLVNEKLMRQKEIAETTIQAQEKEREEIGKELHDNVNQILATAKIMIDTALSTPALQEVCLQKSRHSLILAIDEIRSISHSLMPPAFEEEDFVQVINDMAENVNLSGKVLLSIDIGGKDGLQFVDNKIKLTLYRIIQEQINNILKYAKASNVNIELNVEESLLHLVISDNGVGFDLHDKIKGIGLRNIASRIELHSGHMHIKTAPGKGCTLAVQIPVAIAQEVEK